MEDLRQRPIQNPMHVLRTPLGLRMLAGETRRRAGLLAGCADAPVIIHDYPMTDGEKAWSSCSTTKCATRSQTWSARRSISR